MNYCSTIIYFCFNFEIDSYMKTLKSATDVLLDDELIEYWEVVNFAHFRI